MKAFLVFLMVISHAALADSIIINRSTKTLTFTNDSGTYTYPVAVGKSATPSPSGTFQIRSKVHNPTWTPPNSIRKEYARKHKYLPDHIPPGPKNPLGSRAMYLSPGLIRIHGTNQPKSIGKAVSHGCIRMGKDDLESLYEMVQVGTTVQIK